MDLAQANKVLKHIDWDDLLVEEDGAVFAVVIDGEAVLATKVHSEEKEDAENDRSVCVVVLIGNQHFRKEGWGGVGSHCYGDYEAVWGALTEVTSTQKTITVYETV